MHINRILMGLLLGLSFSAGLLFVASCSLDHERLTRTWFQPWMGNCPAPSELRPGDVILRFMDSPQSVALAGITLGHFSHGGIIFFREGQPWVVDCLGLNPRPAIKAEPIAEMAADT